MEIIKAIIFGIVEGITEWLPISSTGHMILLNEFINLKVSADFYELFEVIIQLGAILAVVILYFKKIFPWGKGKTKKDTLSIFNLWGKILVACIPAAIIGFLLDDWLDEHLYNSIVVSLMLIIYGVLFILIENHKFKNKKVDDVANITYKQALLIGVFQLLALIPGTSRSGATIIGGLLLGLSRSVAAEFTFVLAIPVMAGASLLKLVKYIINVGLVFTSTEIIILSVSSLVAFAVSLLAIKFIIKFVSNHNYKPFGWYRIVLGLIVLLYFIIK